MKVLIVDDSASFRRELISRLVEMPGITIVGEAESAAVAIALNRTRRPDLMLLDLRLAGSSGFDVLSAVRSAPSVPAVVVVSNMADAYFRARCQQAHVLKFFDKSMEFEGAVEFCRSLLTDGIAVHMSEVESMLIDSSDEDSEDEATAQSASQHENAQLSDPL